MAWIYDGTVVLTNGSKAVTGTGTAWAGGNVLEGDQFNTPTGPYEVQSVASDGSLQLVRAYAGPSVSGQTYSIVPTQGRIVPVAKQLSTLLTNLGAMKDAYVAGDLATVDDLAIKLTTSDLGLATGAAKVGYKQVGNGSIVRTMQSKQRESVSVLDYADSPTTTHGDGIVDDGPMFARVLAAHPGKCIFVPDPPVRYRNANGKLTIPANTALVGATRKGTGISHEFNGDMFELLDNASVINLNVVGNGGSFSGRCFVFTGTNGRQNVAGVRAQDWDGAVQEYEVAAGSQSMTFDCTFARRAAATGSGRYAIVISATQQLGAVPRGFVRIETDGTPSFYFGGCNDTFVTASFIGDLGYTAESRGVIVTATRIANQAALSLNGHNNVIDACDIAPQVTIAVGADNCHLGSNSYNNLPIIDNSGNNRNTMTHWPISYVPALTAGGNAPSIGNGSIVGTYARTGSTITLTIEIGIGSTTSLGTGGLSVSLPQKRHSATIFVGGSVIANRGGVLYMGVLQIPGAVTTASLLRDTTGSITFNSPATFTTGDTIRMSCSYTI